MTSEIKEETDKALKALDLSKLSLRKKELIKQMTKEISQLTHQGEWDFAVRLANYRHEIAKLSKILDWYPPLLEIRKMRDRIKLLKGD